MAKIDLKFLDRDYDTDYIRTTTNGEVISIEISEGVKSCLINLDVPTAIKFAKTLRTGINKVKEGRDEAN